MPPGCPIIPVLERSGGASLGGLLPADGSRAAAPLAAPSHDSGAMSRPSLLLFPPLTSMGTSAAQVSPPPGSGEGCGDPGLLGFFSYGAGDLGDSPAALRLQTGDDEPGNARRCEGRRLEIPRELLQGCSIPAAYQDATILHFAASRGQVEGHRVDLDYLLKDITLKLAAF
ncbi:hypothetical protein TRIUR3_20873 [Triticum urartu]|uniref:Uncharacterized protein n=1 Tax=Triticum urartu TaxID=4572 RepID=M8AGS2_TRIUA|nr:hypothetical protein TRIUR3_20873 [Triticum urartu]